MRPKTAVTLLVGPWLSESRPVASLRVLPMEDAAPPLFDIKRAVEGTVLTINSVRKQAVPWKISLVFIVGVWSLVARQYVRRIWDRSYNSMPKWRRDRKW